MSNLESISTNLKAAMRRMPSAVALITTTDLDDDISVGLAASAVIPVSMYPPSMMISINRKAGAYDAIKGTGLYCINLLSEQHADLVSLFSDGARRRERFDDAAWAKAHGVPYLNGALANIFCKIDATLDYGTHGMLVGAVLEVRASENALPLCWVGGSCASIGPLR